MNLSTNSTSLLQICSDGGDGASPNFMILVLAQLVLRPSLQASASKMATTALYISGADNRNLCGESCKL